MSMLIQTYRNTSVSVSSTKWRLLFLAQARSNDWVVLPEVELRGSVGGSNLCVGATITASQNQGAGYEAGKAVDASLATWWGAGVNAAYQPWWQCERASPFTVAEVVLTQLNSDQSHLLKDLDVQYYNGSSWVTAWSIRNNPNKLGTHTVNTCNSDTFASLGSNLIVGSPTVSGNWTWSSGVLTGANATSEAKWAGILTRGKTYQVTFDYTMTAGSAIRIVQGSTSTLAVTPLNGSSGTRCIKFVPNGTDFCIQADASNFSGTLFNISVKEIIDNNAKLGSELIPDPNFATGTGWSFSGGWSLGSGKAVGSSAASRISCNGILTSGVTYLVRLKYFRTSAVNLRILNNAGGAIRYMSYSLAESGVMSGIFVADGTGIHIEADSNVFTGEIYSVSVRAVL